MVRFFIIMRSSPEIFPPEKTRGLCRVKRQASKDAIGTDRGSRTKHKWIQLLTFHVWHMGFSKERGYLPGEVKANLPPCQKWQISDWIGNALLTVTDKSAEMKLWSLGCSYRRGWKRLCTLRLAHGDSKPLFEAEWGESSKIGKVNISATSNVPEGRLLNISSLRHFLMTLFILSL